MPTPIADPKLLERFEHYMREMPAELAALARAVAAQGSPEFLPLDFSYESLDRLEDFLVDAATRETVDEELYNRVGRYIGQMLVKRAGGKWDYSRLKNDFPGEPLIIALPLLGKRRFFPMAPVDGFRYHHMPGSLRDATEPYDIPHRRRQMFARIACLDAEIEALRAEVRQRLGPAAADLDYSFDSVDVLERALLVALSAHPSRDQRRCLRTRAALYLGTLLQRALGGGVWSLCEDPLDVDFGELVMHDWAPYTLVKNVNPKFDRRLLRPNLEKSIKGALLRK